MTSPQSSPAPPAEPPRTIARACVITHGLADTVGDGLERLAQVAADYDVELMLPAIERAKLGSRPVPCRVCEGEGEGSDLAIVLGGDGTTLRALQRFRTTGIPVVAINYGRVGFLTTARADELESAVARIFRGEYRVEELPCVAVSRNGELLGLAVNDVVVTSDVHGRMAAVSWSVDDVELGTIGCDGIIVCTPSGSTAYNLSAGGPVLGWGLDAVSVTFVAPHSLAVRPLVLSRGHRISVRNVGPVDVRVVLDGHVEHRALRIDDCVEVTLADECARLALLPEVSFLQRYRDTFAR